MKRPAHGGQWTIQDIRRANREAGLFYFEPATMRFFNSEVLEYTFEGSEHVYFVTSEQFVGSQGTKPRRYTVREFNPDTSEIRTVEPFNELSCVRALRIAKALAAKERG